MKKNKIEKVWIEQKIDEYPDTSIIGEYTDKKDDWVICCRCGEFIAIIEKDNQRQEQIDEDISNLENEGENEEAEKQIEELKKELAGLELHECPHTSREYNYFKPYSGGKPEGSEEYQKYGKQDFEQMEGLNNNDWCFLGIIAKAKIRTANGTSQTIRSAGLWGIESNSGDYLEEVGKEQLEELRAELESLGFKKRAIDYAFKNVETKN